MKVDIIQRGKHKHFGKKRARKTGGREGASHRCNSQEKNDVDVPGHVIVRLQVGNRAGISNDRLRPSS